MKNKKNTRVLKIDSSLLFLKVSILALSGPAFIILALAK